MHNANGTAEFTRNLSARVCRATTPSNVGGRALTDLRHRLRTSVSVDVGVAQRGDDPVKALSSDRRSRAVAIAGPRRWKTLPDVSA